MPFNSAWYCAFDNADEVLAHGGTEQGNIHVVDPLFANINLEELDLHLKSQAGRYDPISQTWVEDSVTSPCVDAGNPTILVDEPAYNGKRVNMGAFGGTAQASKSLPDLNGDGTVNFKDMGDFTGDGIEGLPDVKILARNWLKCR